MKAAIPYVPTLVPSSIKGSCQMSEFHSRLGKASFMLSEQLHLLGEVGEEVGSMLANKTSVFS